MGHKSKKSKRWRGIGGDTRRLYAPLPGCLSTAAPSEVDHLISGHEEFRFRIASDCKVQIQFNGTVTPSAIRQLINYLELSVGAFPEDGTVPAAQD